VRDAKLPVPGEPPREDRVRNHVRKNVSVGRRAWRGAIAVLLRKCCSPKKRSRSCVRENAGGGNFAGGTFAITGATVPRFRTTVQTRSCERGYRHRSIGHRSRVLTNAATDAWIERRVHRRPLRAFSITVWIARSVTSYLRASFEYETPPPAYSATIAARCSSVNRAVWRLAWLKDMLLMVYRDVVRCEMGT
jgi:hypothetical protein